MSDTIWNKVKYFMIGSEKEDDEIEKEVEVEEKTYVTKTDDRDIITESISRPANRANLVDVSNPNHMKVIVYKPTKYSDAEQIVKNLKAKKPVVVNIEDIDIELARKIFNFCSGAICALDGEMKKISKEIFILAPKNVTLDAEKAKPKKTDDDTPFDWRK